MIILYVALMWFVLHMIVVYVCHKISDEWYKKKDHWFKLYSFEKQGMFYHKVWKIKRWKDILPDGGKINSYGFEKSSVNTDLSYLKKFYLETKRAEAIHWGGIFTSLVFLFIQPFPWNLVIFIVAIIIDIPFIMIQRYNRPRFNRLIQRMEERE